MKQISLLAIIIFSTAFLKSCKSYPVDNKDTSDMNRNTAELQKRQEAEKSKFETSELNNFGKPDNK